MVEHISLGDRARGIGPAADRVIRASTLSSMTINCGNKGGSPVRPRIALITPLKDEEQYIEAMIESIVEQQVRPEKWLIIDDGSTDRTPEIVQEYCDKLSFIELLRLPVRSERKPGGEGAIPSGLRRIDLSRFDYLARFDADLLFEENYFRRILDEFESDPRLGIAGGGLYVERNGRLELERVPDYHVRGALKMYRRECFEQLGGLSADIGWDTVDEIHAWNRGWRTRSFVEIRVIHRRPTGEGVNPGRIYRERGRAEYLTWSHPLFVFLKSLRLAARSPRHAWWFLGGFLGSYKGRHERLRDPEFRRTRRRQQVARIFGITTPELHQRS
jgi:biofilm PGA synthesis N-glycosyltransferase PgaC